MRASAPGSYNQDHDLTLLATLHGAAVLLDAQPAPLVFSEVSAVAPAGTAARGPRPLRSTADSRAPPLA